MQHDEMIWQVISHQFCSFRASLGTAKEKNRRHFCRNEYSATGLCNRSSCPLANSKYATIREKDGKVTLYLKTVERAHTPKDLWEKIPLSRNYSIAIAQLDEHLAYFPKNLIHRNKQRLTKIHQYLIRMRKIELKKRAGRGVKMNRVHRKVEQREERREKKALVAANLEKSIEAELVERLARGTYGDIYNFPEVPYQKALEDALQAEQESESEAADDEKEIESEESEDEGEIQYVEDFEDEDSEEVEEMFSDMEDIGDDDEFDVGSAGSKDESGESSSDESEDKLGLKRKIDEKKIRRGPHIEIEYEEDMEEEEEGMEQQSEPVAGMAW